MTLKNQKNSVLDETAGDNQSSNSNATLVRRDETSLANYENNKPNSLILPTRRQFLMAASLATAGLLIQPISGFTQSITGKKSSVLDFFKSFGKALFFNALNFLPSGIKPFVDLAASAITQIRGKGFSKWEWQNGCFGNLGAKDSTDLFSLVGGQKKLNAATALLDKDLPNAIKAILASASYVGIQDFAPGFFEDSDNLQAVTDIPLPPAELLPANASDREEFIARWQERLKLQRYFAPNMKSEISKMTSETINSPLTLARDFAVPQIYQSKTGALVMVMYKIGRDTEYKAGENGMGESLVYATNPINENIRQKILKNRNFLTVKKQMDEIVKIILGENASNDVNGRKFNFLVGDN